MLVVGYLVAESALVVTSGAMARPASHVGVVGCAEAAVVLGVHLVHRVYVAMADRVGVAMVVTAVAARLRGVEATVVHPAVVSTMLTTAPHVWTSRWPRMEGADGAELLRRQRGMCDNSVTGDKRPPVAVRMQSAPLAVVLMPPRHSMKAVAVQVVAALDRAAPLAA